MIEDKRYLNAIEIIKKLKKTGYKAYLVGGCVRDMILKLDPKDYDIVTDAKPNEILRLFKRTVKVGMQFGVIIVLINEYEYDVATFRKDLDYIDGRHPEGVEYSNEKEDVLRRDITINGLLYDPIKDKYIDYVGGLDDIKRGIIKTIGDPIKRFSEDYLRLIRAIRFASVFNFKIEEYTYNSIKKLSKNIIKISKERIKSEIEKLLSHKNRWIGLNYIFETNIFKYIFPDVYEKIDYNDIMIMIESIKRLPDYTSFEIPLSLIFIISNKNQINVKIPDHEQLIKIEKTCKNLKLSNSETKKTIELYRLSFSLWNTPSFKEWELKRLFRSTNIKNGLVINSILNEVLNLNSNSIEYSKMKLNEYKDEIYVDPLINGQDLINMGIKSGKIFSKILFDIENNQLEKKITTKNEALNYIKNTYLNN